MKYLKIWLGICLLLGMAGCNKETAFISQKSNESTTSVFYIEIKGAVKYPGIYEFNNPLYLYQLLEVAGGLRSDALITQLNMLLIIDESQSIVIQSHENIVESSKININYATTSLLTQLPQIGLVKAQNIIAYRETNGAFKKIEDIMKVSGIGASTFEAIKDFICV